MTKYKYTEHKLFAQTIDTLSRIKPDFDIS